MGNAAADMKEVHAVGHLQEWMLNESKMYGNHDMVLLVSVLHRLFVCLQYRDGYPEKALNNKRMNLNARFYANEVPSTPDGMLHTLLHSTQLLCYYCTPLPWWGSHCAFATATLWWCFVLGSLGLQGT